MAILKVKMFTLHELVKCLDIFFGKAE